MGHFWDRTGQNRDSKYIYIFHMEPGYCIIVSEFEAIRLFNRFWRDIDEIHLGAQKLV